MYEVVISAHSGGKIVARNVIPPYTKSYAEKLKHNMAPDRLAKLVTRQREGKKRMKSICQVQVPKEAFFNVLRRT